MGSPSRVQKWGGELVRRCKSRVLDICLGGWGMGRLIVKIKRYYLRVGLKVAIWIWHRKSLIKSITCVCKMILIRQGILNGFSFRLKIPRKIREWNLIFWIFQSRNLCLTLEWRLRFTLEWRLKRERKKWKIIKINYLKVWDGLKEVKIFNTSKME